MRRERAARLVVGMVTHFMFPELYACWRRWKTPKYQTLDAAANPENAPSSGSPPTCSHPRNSAPSPGSSTGVSARPWCWASLNTNKACTTSDAVGLLSGSWFQQASICSRSSSTNNFGGSGGHPGRAPAATISGISSSLSSGNGSVPDKT